MSVFGDITKDYVARGESFTIESGGASYEFKAVEISHLKSIELTALRSNGLDWMASYVAASILDKDGNRMTLKQVEMLPEEIAAKFIEMALKVNAPDSGDPEKN